MRPPRVFDPRLRLTGPARGFRSRGASSSLSLAFTRSCGLRRSSASDAVRPNCGSLRPPPFLGPHAIRKRPRPQPRQTSGRGLRLGYFQAIFHTFPHLTKIRETPNFIGLLWLRPLFGLGKFDLVISWEQAEVTRATPNRRRLTDGFIR